MMSDDPKRERRKLRFASTCIMCSADLSVGAFAWWSPQRNVICVHCYSQGRRPTWREPQRLRARVAPGEQLSVAQLLGLMPRAPQGPR